MSIWNPDKQLPDSFFTIPQALYAADDFWLPESEASMRTEFSRANRYFDGDNEVWMSCDNGVRLAGFYNPDVTVDNKKVAYFGYWESDDQLAGNKQLFADLERWAAMKGAEVLYGPINFTTFNQNRLRLNTFEDGCFQGEPYNPSYYPELMHCLGFSVAKKYYSWVQPSAGATQRTQVMFTDAIAKQKAKGFEYKTLSAEYWLNNIEMFYQHVHTIFMDNFGFTSISLDDFQRQYGAALANRMCPQTSHYVESSDGEMAGFFLAFPDYSPLMRQGCENPIAAHEICYETHFPMLERACFLGKSGGINPKYRKEGFFAQLSFLLTQSAERLGSASHSATLVREDNPSRKVAELLFNSPNASRREYALFAKELR